jgi:hypothetical protein
MTSLALAAAAVLRLGRQDSGCSARFLKSFEDIAHEVWNREAELLTLLLSQMSDAAGPDVSESQPGELVEPGAVLIVDILNGNICRSPRVAAPVVPAVPRVTDDAGV